MSLRFGRMLQFLLRRLWNRRPWRPKVRLRDDAFWIDPDAGLDWRPIELAPLTPLLITSRTRQRISDEAIRNMAGVESDDRNKEL